MWKILIADDDFGTRKLLNRLLYRRAIVDHACSGHEAIQGFEFSVTHSDPYDAILLDVTMPDMTGTQALEKIRDLESRMGIPLGKGVPILMVTGRKDQMMNSFGKGADDFVLKPFEMASLLEKIQKWIDSRKSNRSEL